MKGLFPYLIDRDLTTFETNKCIRNMISALKKGEIVSMCEPSRNIITVSHRIRTKVGDTAKVTVERPAIIIEFQEKARKD